jgi:hypothetical protein
MWCLCQVVSNSIRLAIHTYALAASGCEAQPAEQLLQPHSHSAAVKFRAVAPVPEQQLAQQQLPQLAGQQLSIWHAQLQQHAS